MALHNPPVTVVRMVATGANASTTTTALTYNDTALTMLGTPFVLTDDITRNVIEALCNHPDSNVWMLAQNLGNALGLWPDG